MVNLPTEPKAISPPLLQESSKEWMTETSLKKIDSALRNNRKIVLISACIFPTVILISKTIAEIVFICFFGLGTLALVSLSFLDSWNQAIDLQIKEAQEKNEPLPVKNPKMATGIHIANKIMALTFPWCLGAGISLQLSYLMPVPLAACLGSLSAVPLALLSYSSHFFAVDEVKPSDIEPTEQGSNEPTIEKKEDKPLEKSNIEEPKNEQFDTNLAEQQPEQSKLNENCDGERTSLEK